VYMLTQLCATLKGIVEQVKQSSFGTFIIVLGSVTFQFLPQGFLNTLFVSLLQSSHPQTVVIVSAFAHNMKIMQPDFNCYERRSEMKQ